MNDTIQTYTFPKLTQLTSQGQVKVEKRAVQPEVAVRATIERLCEQALAEVRAEAKAQAAAVLKSARQKGYEDGLKRGLARAAQAVQSLRRAIAEVEGEKKYFREQAETFCVELVLAIMGRLLESEVVRAEFVSKLVRCGLEALSPIKPTKISLNPADLALLGSRLDGLPVEGDETVAPGHAKVESGELFVEGGIDDAFAQIRDAIVRTQNWRLKKSKNR